MEVLIQEKSQINIQFFAKKKQFKVFITIKSRDVAINFFEQVFRMKELPILDQEDIMHEIGRRDMRAYYVKSEAEYQALAFKKYT